jgi:hypothetical protein
MSRSDEKREAPKFVMPGLDPGIHDFPSKQDVDGWVKPGHDAE